jgi:hypothetical protein
MANNRNLILKPNWNVGGQQGCCGIGTIARLKANYTSESQRDAALEAWLELENPHPMLSDIPNWENQYLREILLQLVRRPQGAGWSGVSETWGVAANWHGGAVDSNIAYAAVLQSLSPYAIYFLSDNMDAEGDVHLGAFSTRGFVQWCQEQNLGQFQTTGPITSMRTQRHIQGWMWTPNWTSVGHTITKYNLEFRQYIKRINDDDRIKGPEQEKRREHSLKQQELQTSLAAGWASSTG